MDLKKELQDIDNLLAKKGVSIHQRPIHAVMEFGKKHKISLPLTTGPSIVPDKDLPYPKENERYAEFIHNWYDEAYGDRVKYDFSTGKIVLLIKNAPWQMNIPLVYGMIIPVIDVSLEEKKRNKTFSKGPMEYNMLSSIQNITKDFACGLKKPELIYIKKRFMIALDVCHNLKNRYGAQYISQAHSDLLASVEHLMRGKPEFGQSRWSSLQFSEKYIKALLNSCGIEFPNTHKLNILLRLVPNIDIDNFVENIEKVQCNASIRYGEEPSELIQAIEAHENAIDLVSKLKKCWIK